MSENDKMMNKHSISVKDRFSAPGQLTTAEERWQIMKENMFKSAKQYIPVTKRKEDKKMNDSRNFRPGGREKKSQDRRTEIQTTRQISEKELK